MRALLLCVLLVASASAQVPADSVTTGSILGTVTDAETGEPLIGASIYLVETQIGASTDLDGRYTIVQVPTGTYAVRVSYTGFITVDTTVAVVPGASTRMNAVLEWSNQLVDCTHCWAPIAPRGPFFARIVTYGYVGDGCYVLEPGDTFTRDG